MNGSSVRLTSRLSALLALLACAPPPVGADEGGQTTTTSNESGSDTETETETGDPSMTSAPLDVYKPSDCDPWLQDCPEGEKCVPYSSSGGTWDDNKCVPVLGERGVGEPCEYDGVVAGTDDCDATSLCWQVEEIDGELVGTCHLFCAGTEGDPECPEGYVCPLYSNGSITICELSCDPLVQDCPDGRDCHWGNIYFQCITSGEGLGVGDACRYINSCDGGLACLSGDVIPGCASQGCCAPYCELGLGDAQCEALPGTTCVAFFEQGMAPPGTDHIGVCVAP